MPGGEAGSWSGGFGVIRPGWQLYVGAVGKAAEHAHHAIQIVVADGPLVLLDGTGRRHGCTAAVIPANIPHAIAEGSPRAVMLYVEPESVVGRAVTERIIGDPVSACSWIDSGPAVDVAALSDLAADPPEALVGRILAALGIDLPATPGRAVHPALERAIRYLPTILDGPVRVAAVATEVGISAGRLRTLFAEEIGLSFRRYVLWLRLQRAVESVLGGSTLTEAAHAAGFADSAHLTKVARRTFGLAPSQLAKSVAPFTPSA